jgi:hypothetical protein
MRQPRWSWLCREIEQGGTQERHERANECRAGRNLGKRAPPVVGGAGCWIQETGNADRVRRLSILSGQSRQVVANLPAMGG